jgi:thymidylate synthase
MEVVVMNPKHAVLETLRRTLELGESAGARGQDAQEIVGYTLRILEPWNFIFDIPERNLNHSIGALELCGLIGQTDIDTPSRTVVKALGQFQNSGTAWGAYGPRLRGQLGLLLNELANDLFTRRAVITIYDGRVDLGRKVNDIPCTLGMQILIRNDQVHMITRMRSNDAWLGLPYDLMMFAGLQRSIAHWMGFPPGELIHQVGSMHLYARNRAAAQHVWSVNAGWAPVTEKYAPVPWLLPDFTYAVQYCQDVLAGIRRSPQTELEIWLWENITQKYVHQIAEPGA